MSALSMLRMQVLVEQRVFWRNRSTVFFTFVLPIVLLFAVAAGNDVGDIAPFMLGLGILSTGFQGLAIQLSMHRDQGVLKQLMATPLPAWILIVGKALSTMVVMALEAAIIVATAIVVFDAPAPEHVVLLIAFVLMGTGTFVALGFALASIVPTSDAAPAITNAAYIALLLATVAVATVEDMPTAVHTIGELLPLERVITPIKHAWFGTWQTRDAWSAVVLTAWAALGSAWSLRRFRWEPAGER